jgi:hypothetical protein
VPGAGDQLGIRHHDGAEGQRRQRQGTGGKEDHAQGRIVPRQRRAGGLGAIHARAHQLGGGVAESGAGGEHDWIAAHGAVRAGPQQQRAHLQAQGTVQDRHRDHAPGGGVDAMVQDDDGQQAEQDAGAQAAHGQCQPQVAPEAGQHHRRGAEQQGIGDFDRENVRDLAARREQRERQHRHGIRRRPWTDAARAAALQR